VAKRGSTIRQFNFAYFIVIDKTAYDCEPIQHTPVSHSREITYFVFDVDVHIQTPVEDLPAGMSPKCIVWQKLWWVITVLL